MIPRFVTPEERKLYKYCNKVFKKASLVLKKEIPEHVLKVELVNLLEDRFKI